MAWGEPNAPVPAIPVIMRLWVVQRIFLTLFFYSALYETHESLTQPPRKRVRKILLLWLAAAQKLWNSLKGWQDLSLFLGEYFISWLLNIWYMKSWNVNRDKGYGKMSLCHWPRVYNWMQALGKTTNIYIPKWKCIYGNLLDKRE